MNRRRRRALPASPTAGLLPLIGSGIPALPAVLRRNNIGGY